MPSSLRIALAQINPTVGDLTGNARKISAWIGQARAAGADLVAFPELALCGYLPEDLLLQPKFIDDNLSALSSVAAQCRGIVALVGFVDRQDDLYNAAAIIHDGQVRFVYRKQFLPNYGVFDEGRYFKPGHTAPVFIQNGVTIGVNICEDIWHAEGPATLQAIGGDAQLIVNITASPYHIGKPRLREKMLALRARENGTTIVYANCVGGQDEIVFDGGSLVYDATGRQIGRAKAFEEELLVLDVTLHRFPRPKCLDRRRKTLKPTFMEVPVFNLDSPAMASAYQQMQSVHKPMSSARQQMPSSEQLMLSPEQLMLSHEQLMLSPEQLLPSSEQLLPSSEQPMPSVQQPMPSAPPAVAVPLSMGPSIAKRISVAGEMYRALMLGLSDYVAKNGFKTVVLGLSGGIDSALTATIAADALGAGNVVGVFMPSRYTSPQSGEDATQLAAHLGIRLMTLSIEGPFESIRSLLSPTFAGATFAAGQASGLAEENLQSRIRGNILMALSNRFGWLVLATGNKSEMSVGYTTLYGDMAGGFSVIKDLWKTEVYRLARFRNRTDRPIPRRILLRPPTAELRPNQTDQDTLPPYALLDPILQAYIEDDRSVGEIVTRLTASMAGKAAMGRTGSSGETTRLQVIRVLEMVARSEFKRKQAPVGTKITRRALGKDRRMPIAQRYRNGDCGT